MRSRRELLTLGAGLAAGAALPAAAQSWPTPPPGDIVWQTLPPTAGAPQPPAQPYPPTTTWPAPPQPNTWNQPAPQPNWNAPATQPNWSAPAQPQPQPPAPPPQAPARDNTFSQDEIVTAAAGFFGLTAQTVAAAAERIFRDQGSPNGYIAGEEGSGAWIVGLRYGRGTLVMKAGPTEQVFWQGPSIGFDFGGNASKVFTLIYRLESALQIYRRFPGVEGSAYFIGGIGVNYQRADNIVLAPMRAGVGLRGGANVGYLAYSRNRRIVPI